AGTATARGVDALAQDPGVAHVALDVTLQADLAEAVPLINADDVHSSLGRTGEGVTVAVLDTGIDTDHPMLSDDFVYQACFLVESTCPGGGTTGTSAEDGHGHGTHVSGIVTLAGPPVGIAPDASIEAYKVLQNTGSGSFSNVLSAYDDIIVNHPEVDLINMSVSNGGSYAPNGCDGLIPAFTTAVATTRAMGITTFASAGNSSSKTGIGFPACVGDVVAVGAVYDADVGSQAFGACSDPSTAPDQVTCFSQSHPGLDLLAPGARIQSAGIGGGLATLSGTSMSSPAAAAAAALLLESEPALMPADLEARLRETGVPVTDAANNVTSCRVDAYEAVVNDGGPVCSPSGPPPPANDDFADAVAAGEPLPYGNAQTTAFATTEVGEPSPCGGIASTVWYSFTPTSDAPIEVSTVGSNYDTVLAIYSGPSLDSLALAGCNDDFSSLQSRVQFTANADTTYSIQAGGFLGAAGD
ncbi:MAG: S8 family serine peptidase, partial [Dehalococcoidia bacterium]|nr:S8 family serine peptidase [Dehalococcoidia bacterium]